MANSKSTRQVRRGEPEFERQYLVRMGLLKPAPSERDQLRELISCAEYLLPVAQAGAQPGNDPERVSAWLMALAATARRRLLDGGMGASAPMLTSGGVPDRPGTSTNANGLGKPTAQARSNSSTRK